MGWEDRGKSGRYYVRKRWRKGTCHSEYLGSGPLAEAIAALDAAERAERRAEQERRQQQRHEYEAAERQIGELCEDVDTLVTATLLDAGYYQHKGTWRRKHGRLITDIADERGSDGDTDCYRAGESG